MKLIGLFKIKLINRLVLLKKVLTFGNVGLTSLTGAFYNANNLIEVPITIPITITNLSYTFYGATSFNQSLSGWNTSNVTYMTYL